MGGAIWFLHDIVDDDWRIEINPMLMNHQGLELVKWNNLIIELCKIDSSRIHILVLRKNTPEFVDDFLLLSSSCGMENRVKEILSASGYDNDRREEYSVIFPRRFCHLSNHRTHACTRCGHSMKPHIQLTK